MSEPQRTQRHEPSASESLLDLAHTESAAIARSMELIASLQRKHGLNLDDIGELVRNREQYLAAPLSIFRSSMGPLEAVVRYLHEVTELRLCAIARLLSRSETTIWTTYQHAKTKGTLPIDLDGPTIPISLLANRKLSVLEIVCIQLKKKGMTYRAIGEMLGRNERTIWTCVDRARRKHGQ